MDIDDSPTGPAASLRGPLDGGQLARGGSEGLQAEATLPSRPSPDADGAEMDVDSAPEASQPGANGGEPVGAPVRLSVCLSALGRKQP
jgi:hypothetical protein